ncbi:hypothetical protein CUN34_11780 [Enterococcus faecium]|uniref:hypothetical protein n=1 Tax=Enterococcus TaxID=1350 RepID=UPI000BBBD47B|nr:hypothetical protein [Enterococcus faecium]EGP0010937.1 hypothetical protein [Enterococcus faecium]EGP4734691.1 hypothetical protein [Enterococcus faecium]EGP4879637.1 hypothetical protein [Enterococcus faecium]EGP4907725.1 hypothetical protein [Enterococcus faecium]EGP4947997.1 hypothetical protein [Enterococcus faecium]
MQTFTQHELEIISGHKQITGSNANKLSVIKSEVGEMLSMLKSDLGKKYIEDDEQRHYTLKNYQSVYDKLEKMSEDEFKQIDLSGIEELE